MAYCCMSSMQRSSVSFQVCTTVVYDTVCIFRIISSMHYCSIWYSLQCMLYIASVRWFMIKYAETLRSIWGTHYCSVWYSMRYMLCTAHCSLWWRMQRPIPGKAAPATSKAEPRKLNPAWLLWHIKRSNNISLLIDVYRSLYATSKAEPRSCPVYALYHT
jgi:hypothetical protein